MTSSENLYEMSALVSRQAELFEQLADANTAQEAAREAIASGDKDAAIESLRVSVNALADIAGNVFVHTNTLWFAVGRLADAIGDKEVSEAAEVIQVEGDALKKLASKIFTDTI